MKRVRKALAVALITLMTAMSGIPADAKEVSRFTDVSPTAWYAEAVDWAAREGIFRGTGENTFSPETGMTRAMFVTVLGRMAGVSPTRTSTAFADIKPTAYYAPYVHWAKENGIVSGTGASTFSPDLLVTREQAACFLYRYALWLGMDPAVTGTIAGYRDADKVSPYAQDAMAWAVGHDLLKGSDGLLDPQGTATRAQIAAILRRAECVLVPPQEGQESPELARIKALVAERLPAECRWDERALSCGWYGPMTLRMNGSLRNIAEGCVYLLTELDGITYEVYCIMEPEPGSYVCWYG